MRAVPIPSLVRPSLLLCLLLACVWPAWAQERLRIVYPGPFNLAYLPLDVATKIGADRAEGVVLVPQYATGAALQQLQNRNADFAVGGLPAAMTAKASGNDIVTIAAVGDLPVFVLTVRADLKDQVKRPRDLAGRAIGVISSTLTVRTIAHQLLGLLLQSEGVALDQVRVVSSGLTWEEQSAILRSRSADAIFGFEPFASRLVEEGLAFELFNLGKPADAARVPGAGLLPASLHTRSDVLRDAPHKAEKMVAVLRRTLRWLAEHTPEQIVAALQIDDAAARAALLKSLRQYPRLYSRDAKFSEQQLRETARFYAAGEGAQRPVALDGLIDARWAGRKP